MIVLSLTTADIEFEPVTNKASVFKLSVSLPVEPLNANVLAIPVKLLPSPLNEPVNEPVAVVVKLLIVVPFN